MLPVNTAETYGPERLESNSLYGAGILCFPNKFQILAERTGAIVGEIHILSLTATKSKLTNKNLHFIHSLGASMMLDLVSEFESWLYHLLAGGLGKII